MWESPAGGASGKLRFRDRILDYAAVFGAGLIAATAIGLLIGVLTAARVAQAVGYTIVLFGVICLLAGGMSGGEYSVLGVGKGAGRYTYVAGKGDKSLLGELRGGYRPRANPVAFWQVIAGALYVVIGVAVITGTS